MKKIIIPLSKEQIFDLANNIDGIILPLKDYSINYINIFTLEDIRKIKKIFTKKVYIFINKNILNDEIENLKQILQKLNEISIDGVFFYDLSVLNIYKKNNYNFNLIWSQEHFTTNASTISYYLEDGVNTAYLSSEITKKETIEIIDKVKEPLFINVFGYIPMFTSRRNLVDNYKKTFNLEDNSKINYIEKEGKKYPIVDTIHGSFVYSDNILNLVSECLSFLENKDYYAVFNSNLIYEDKFKKTIKLYSTLDKQNIEMIEKELQKMYNNLDKGFSYNETIYRVKK